MPLDRFARIELDSAATNCHYLLGCDILVFDRDSLSDAMVGFVSIT